MTDDFGFRRKDPLAPLGRRWDDPRHDRLALPRPGFDHRGNPLCPPTFVSTQLGSHVGTMYPGLSTLHAANGTTYNVDVCRNVRDGAGRVIGQIDALNHFTSK